LLAAVLVLQACYGSTDDLPRSTPDSSTDPMPDPGVDWVDHGGFRATPEKPFPSAAVEAAMPSLAAIEGTVALVYRSTIGDGTAHVAFQLLDAVGGTVGPSAVVASGPGLAEAIPNVSSADDGSFLVCALRASPRAIIMTRFSADGTMTASTETPVEDGVMSPISGPILVDGSAFVVTEYSGGVPGEIALFRFAHPTLVLDAWSRMVSFDGFGVHPVLMKSMFDVELVVNSISTNTTAGWHSAIEHVYTDTMAFTGAFTSFGHDTRGNPILAHHGAMGETTWYGFSVLLSETDPSWHLMIFDDVGDEHYGEGAWIGPWLPGMSVHWRMDSAMSDLPTGGAAFSVLESGRWQVWAFVIDGGGPPAPREIFVVGDADPSYPPNTAIAWTSGGFLFVWDEACTGGVCLSSSFVEVD